MTDLATDRTAGAGRDPGEPGPRTEDLERHRGELTAHCCRLLGSASEAEDAVQDTLVRAWRGLDGFEGRSSLRSWLYRIATNVCCDLLDGSRRRPRPVDLGPARAENAPEPGLSPDTAWVGPVPDDGVHVPHADPADLAVTRDAVRLAFVAALQHLPPRQRAVLILRDVLSWRAAEVADLLDTSVPSVNSALQRARATLAARDLAPVEPQEPLADVDRLLLSRYVDAFERHDVAELTFLLQEDASRWPPQCRPWRRGRADDRGPGAGGARRALPRQRAAAATTPESARRCRDRPGGRHCADEPRRPPSHRLSGAPVGRLMRAVTYAAYGEPPTLAEVPEPVCPDDGVVVQVGATGVCRSDWHAWRGHDPVALPHVPGHELAGTVVQVGPGVRHWRSGDRVTVPFVCGCGRCEYCAAGQQQVCPNQTQPGFTGPGSFAERVALRAADTNLVALPDGVGFVAAAALGCRFATAYRALTAHGRLEDGQWLAVHGCGGVGLSAVMIGVSLGARVVAVDVSAAALRRARELGARAAVDVGDTPDVAAAVREVSGGGAHVSVDALGSPATAVASVRSLRRRGRHVQVGLLLGPASTPPLPLDLVVAHELEVHGSHGMAAHEYPPMLRLVADGVLRPDRLVGRVLGLADGGRALAAMDDPSAGADGMTVLDPAR